MKNEKPYHLMTPAERTAKRISDNKQIDERVTFRKQVNSGYEAKRAGDKLRKSIQEFTRQEPGLVAGFIDSFPEAAESLGLRPVTFRRIAC